MHVFFEFVARSCSMTLQVGVRWRIVVNGGIEACLVVAF